MITYSYMDYTTGEHNSFQSGDWIIPVITDILQAAYDATPEPPIPTDSTDKNVRRRVACTRMINFLNQVEVDDED